MNDDLISRSELKNHKFVGIQFGCIRNGKTREIINQAYRQGWNDAIDAIIDNAPTVEYPFYAEAYQTGYEEGYAQGYENCKKDVIHSIAKQYNEHNELVPSWLQIGNIREADNDKAN